MIPGKRYELIIYSKNDQLGSAGYTAAIPLNSGSSPLALDSLRIGNMRLSSVKSMLESFAKPWEEENYDYTAARNKEEAAVAAAVSASLLVRDTSETLDEVDVKYRLRCLLIPPSGKYVESNGFWNEDEFHLGAETDIGLSIGFAFFFRSFGTDEIETGMYTLEVYDWDSKDFLGRTTFSITD